VATKSSARQQVTPRLRRECPRVEDEQLVAREDREPAFELLGITTAGEIGVVPPRVTEVRRLADHPLDLAAQAVFFPVDRVLEGERLPPERDLVVVVRERTVGRISKQGDQARIRQEARDPPRRERV